MKCEPTDIVYVTSVVPDDVALNICQQMSKELNLRCEGFKTIQDVFPILSSPFQKIDFVVIDIKDLYDQDGADLLDLIRTLYTLIKCTVFRPNEKSKPQKRSTKIVVLIGEDTTPQQLKEVLSLKEIDYLSLRVGPKVTYEMIRRCVENYINYGEREPKFIMDLIKEKKIKTANIDDEIKLTIRQSQIFDIVTTRGISNKHIAKMLKISESTVKLHMGAILKKYGLKNRTQLAVFSKKNPMKITEVQPV